MGAGVGKTARGERLSLPARGELVEPCERYTPFRDLLTPFDMLRVSGESPLYSGSGILSVGDVMRVLHSVYRLPKDLLRSVRRWQADRQYIRGYKRYPETEEEIAWAEAASFWGIEEEWMWDDDLSKDTESRGSNT